MLTKKVQYTDLNGQERSDTLYFNLSEVELARLEVSYPGGLEEHVNNMNAQERPDEILDLFEKVIGMSYGTKSEDGRYFVKTKEETEKFMNSMAYSSLFMELMSDTDKAVAFFTAVVHIQPKKE